MYLQPIEEPRRNMPPIQFVSATYLIMMCGVGTQYSMHLIRNERWSKAHLNCHLRVFCRKWVRWLIYYYPMCWSGLRSCCFLLFISWGDCLLGRGKKSRLLIQEEKRSAPWFLCWAALSAWKRNHSLDIDQAVGTMYWCLFRETKQLN